MPSRLASAPLCGRGPCPPRFEYSISVPSNTTPMPSPMQGATGAGGDDEGGSDGGGSEGGGGGDGGGAGGDGGGSSHSGGGKGGGGGGSLATTGHTPGRFEGPANQKRWQQPLLYRVPNVKSKLEVCWKWTVNEAASCVEDSWSGRVLNGLGMLVLVPARNRFAEPPRTDCTMRLLPFA